MSSPNVRIFYKKILKCRNVWLILLISVCIIVLTYFGSILVVGINNGFEMFQQEVSDSGATICTRRMVKVVEPF